MGVNDLVIDLPKASGVAVRVPDKFSVAQLLVDLESTKSGRAINIKVKMRVRLALGHDVTTTDLAQRVLLVG